MSLQAPDPEAVKAQLLSDVYWQAPVRPAILAGIYPSKDIPVTSTEKGIHDQGLAYDLSSLVTSARNGSHTITPIETGEPLPEDVNPRQFLKLIIDACDPITRRRFRSKERQRQRALRAFQRDLGMSFIPMAVFEDYLERIYEVDLPDSGPATVTSAFSLNVARVASRAAFYARPHHETGQYAAHMSGVLGVIERHRNAHIADLAGKLAAIPQVKVGELYSRRRIPESFSRARIVSAELVEVDQVTWQQPPHDGGGNARSKPKKEHAKSSVFRPGFAAAF